MKYKALLGKRGEIFQLHPRPVTFATTDGRQQVVRNAWRLEEVIVSSGLKLSSVDTGQHIEILADNLQNYQSPNSLWLRAQLMLVDGEVQFHPIPGHIGSKGPGSAFAIILPVGYSNETWASIHGVGAPAGTVVLVFTWLLEGRCWLQPGEVEPAADGRWLHPQCHLNSPRDRYIAALAVREEDVSAVRMLFAEALPNIRAAEHRLKALGISFVMTEPRRLELVRIEDRAV